MVNISAPFGARRLQLLNISRPRHDGRHFLDDIFKCIFVNKKICILIKLSLTVVRNGPINNIQALGQIKVCRLAGTKPLSEPMLVVYWRIFASLGLNELMLQFVDLAGIWGIECDFYLRANDSVHSSDWNTFENNKYVYWISPESA